MRNKKNALRLGAVAAVIFASVAVSAVPAFADPDDTPLDGPYATLVGTGSDTTQDVMNGLAASINAAKGTLFIASYDATGSATITTRTGQTAWNRPANSGQGRSALAASNGALSGYGGAGATDFARSSSSASGNNGGPMTPIPFATDALSFAISPGSYLPRNINIGSAAQDSITPAPLTLRNIYRCAAGLTVSDANGDAVAITPLLPKSGSGTRDTFIAKLGLTEAQISAGGCVSDLGGNLQEHDGSYVKKPTDILPFSVAQYIAQGNHASLTPAPTERRGNIVIGAPSGVNPFRATSTGVELNLPAYVGTTMTRTVYNVVPYAKVDGNGTGDDANLIETFVGSGSLVCSRTAVIQAFGFGPVANCGAITIQQSWPTT